MRTIDVEVLFGVICEWVCLFAIVLYLSYDHTTSLSDCEWSYLDLRVRIENLVVLGRGVFQYANIVQVHVHVGVCPAPLFTGRGSFFIFE